MYHLPTKAVFEILTDPSQAALGGFPVFGFAVWLFYVCQGDIITDDTKELATIGHQAIVAYLSHAATHCGVLARP
jgi:hypothetical protein